MFRSVFIYLSCLISLFQGVCAYQYELAVATIFQNEGPYLREWIEYHRMVGVEHFWLYNDGSEDNWQVQLQPYINEGIVEVVDWPSFGFLNHIHNQILAMRDAHKKARGVTKWLALIDADEFLFPAQENTVTECLQNHFNQAGAVYINWHHFGTGGIYLKKDESCLFRLTACSNKFHPKNGIGKSIVRPDITKAEALWTIHHCVSPWVKYYNGDGQFIEHDGEDLKTDRKVHDKYIRLNHYTMRDESYFHNIRLPRAKGIGIEEWLVWEHYYAFNKERNYAIIDFICKKHPHMFENYWKHHIFEDK